MVSGKTCFTVLLVGGILSLVRLGIAQPSAQLDSLTQALATTRQPVERVALLNALAYQYYRLDVVQAKRYALQAQALAQAEGLRVEEARALINLGRCYRQENQLDSARGALVAAQRLGEAAGDLPSLMDAANNLGAVAILTGDAEAAKAGFEASLGYAQQIPDLRGQANAYNNLTIVAEAEGEPEAALAYLAQALAIYRRVGDTSGIARVMNNQAYIYDDLEQNDSAIAILFRVLPIQEAQGLRAQEAATRNQLGILLGEKKLGDQALEQYRLSYEISTSIGDAQGAAQAYQNMAALLLERGQTREARQAYAQALAMARQAGDDEATAKILVNIAGLYLDVSEHTDTARLYLAEAESLLVDLDSDAWTFFYHNQGNLATKEGRYPEARTAYLRQLTSAREWGQLQLVASALDALSRWHRRQQNYGQALAYQDTFMQISDSLFSQEAAANLNQLRVAYQSEKTERANLILQQDLTARQLELSQQRAQRNLILAIGSFLLLLGLGGFGWYRYQQQLRARAREMLLQQERARKEQLAELDALKSRFFANISHEFRTPLTLILGQNQHLQATVDDPALDAKFDMVDRNSRRLLEMVNQVLDLAKLESGKLEFHPQALDLIPFLKNQLFSFESLADQKQQVLAFDSEAESLLLVADPEKLERVFYNLLSNAIKFTPSGGTIRLRVARQGERVRVGLQDSGVGIPAAQQARIFDRFHQAPGSDARTSPGTGIGLALAKEIVEQHQGTLEVESEEGKGSTFWVTLPLSPVAATPAAYAPQLEPLPEALAQARTAAKTTGPQILVVEDNADVRAYLHQELEALGYRVTQAEDGLAGLAAARAEQPDLIISDVMMPKMDGFELARAIRADIQASHIPLILLTAKSSVESRITGLETGVDAYLTKPFHAQELKVRVAKLIEQRQQLRQRFAEALVIKAEEVSAVPMDQQFLQQVTATIEAQLTDEQFGVEPLAEAVSMSVTHLNRKLNALVGQSAGKLIRSMRLQRAADLLRQEAGTVSDIGYELCFSDPTNFARAFKAQFGVTPSQWREGGAGEAD
jgi:signal transduction histidine kinase/DNA-binding response OmpR family regulator